MMMSFQELETAVARLPRYELMRFRTWFDDFDAERWDAQFEEDVKAGKLDALAQQAIADLNAGRCRPL